MHTEQAFTTDPRGFDFAATEKKFCRIPREKARLIVLTDIGPWDSEPDDAQSLVRLVLYSNEYDIEGIIPNASWCHKETLDEGFLQRIRDVIRAYGRVRDCLTVHAKGYPAEEQLLSVVARGTCYVNMEKRAPHYSEEELESFRLAGQIRNVGEGLSCDGSRLIVKALEKRDPRTLYISLWGGCGTLAQAVYDMEQTKSREEIVSLFRNVIVYDIDGQDDCGAWICSRYPELTWLRSDVAFWGFSETPIRNPAQFGENCYVGNLDTVSAEWVSEHIQSVGALGKVYPLAKFGLETDSPSILNLIHNGLSDHRFYAWGGWGGRHTRTLSQNVPGEHFLKEYCYENQPFYMHRDAPDNWWDPYHRELLGNSVLAAVARWRDDYQNDMKCRMQWSVTASYEEANHNPVVVLNGDASGEILVCHARPGETVTLDASQSYHPNGKALFFRWYEYADAGTYRGQKGRVGIEGEETPIAAITLPEAPGEEIHIILEVFDRDAAYPMKSYRRIVFYTGETGLRRPYRVVNDTEFTYRGAWKYCTEQYGCHNGDFHCACEAGAKAELTFRGCRAALFGCAYRSNGIAEIWLDGEKVEEKSFFGKYDRWENDRRSSGSPNNFGIPVSIGDTPLYLSPRLADGEHTLTVIVKGEKEPLSAGTDIIIDRAVVWENL